MEAAQSPVIYALFPQLNRDDELNIFQISDLTALPAAFVHYPSQEKSIMQKE